MLRFIRHMQISRRLLFAFLLAAVVPGIIISILGFAFINAQKTRSQAILTNIRAFKTANTTGAEIPRLLQLLNTAYMDQPLPKGKTQAALPGTPTSEEAIKQARDASAQLERDLHSYQRDYQLSTSSQMSGTSDLLLNDEPQNTLARQQQSELDQLIQTIWPNYRGAQEQVLQAIERKASLDQTTALLHTAHDKQALLQQSWNRITHIAEQTTASTASVGNSQTDQILLATLVAFLSTIIVVTAIGYIIYLTIVRPLHQLALLTRQIGRGDTQARATIKGNDEITLVAASMNNMLDSIVMLLQEAQTQRDGLQGQVEKLVSEVSGISEGDLRVRAQISADSLGVLADSFNYMIEELGSLVVRVKIVASEVARTTQVVQHTMTQLVETGRLQLGEMGEASHEVEILTASNRQVAERSQELFEVARIARQDVQAGREAVRMTLTGISRINENIQATANKVLNLGERSRQIDEIVEAISSIAHQTNRLALDAAIQAAMAGENGKGFGAVAADIRRLAERSKAQANMISQIVRGVRADIEAAAQSMQDTENESAAGSRLTHEASISLEAIFAAIEHQAREIEHIYQMATQQLHSSTAIAQIVQRVSQATHQSSANTQEGSQHMERLTKLVEQLRTSVEAFKLREDQRYFSPGPQTLDQQDTPLTVSGVFRTIRAFSQPMRAARRPQPGNVEDPVTPMPQVTGTLLPFYAKEEPSPEDSGWGWTEANAQPAPKLDHKEEKGALQVPQLQEGEVSQRS